MSVISVLSEAEAGESQGQEFETSLTNINPVSIKNTKISWAWRHVAVIPATREAVAGESLEHGGRSCSEPSKVTPLYSSLVTE